MNTSALLVRASNWRSVVPGKVRDTTSLLESLDGEFEGWQEGSLNNEVYLLGLTMLTQMREGLVGRSAPDKLPLPRLAG